MDGENRWLWTFLSKEVTLFLTRKNRGKKEVVEVLGEDYDGVSTQDFYPSYEDAKEAEKTLKTSKDWVRVYACLVERLEKFVTQDGKWKHHSVKKLAKRAFKYLHELFTFILVPGVEPTNNAAERALRPMGIQRKIGGGALELKKAPKTLIL